MNENYLRRYTDIPALAYLLSERKITLLDPQSWDDKNDSHYLSVYKTKKNLKSILALCFTQADETYHHWRVFAGNPSGVCILFKRTELIKILKQQKGIKGGAVKYLTLQEIRVKKPETDQLPFIKRYAFRDENEFRLIYESSTEELSTLDVNIPLSCIERISISPWVHKCLSDPLKKMLKSIDHCSKLKVIRSTLVSNEEWKSIGGSAVSRCRPRAMKD
jgi:hypothetical protein